MKPTRRSFTLSALAGAAAGVSWPAKAAPYEFKFAINVPGSHPISKRTVEAAANILKASDGRLNIKVFPDGQLGSDTDTLSQLRTGALEMVVLSPLILASLIPGAAITGVGFAFKDYTQIWQAMDGNLGAAVREEITSRGLVVLDRAYDNGYRHITNSKRPINVPGDLQNLKLRIPVSPYWVSMFKAFGASTVPIGFAELYSALQTKVVDGQENPLPIISAGKLYEVQSFCSLTGHLWDGFWIIVNRQAWDKLPDDLKEIVRKTFLQAVAEERSDIQEQNKVVQEDLTKRGLKFNVPNHQTFRDALRNAGFYKEWREKMGSGLWTKLEAVVGDLG